MDPSVSTMDFSVSEYVARPFSDVAADLARDGGEALAEATRQLNRELAHESTVLGEGGGLTVELGVPHVAAWRLMELPVRWLSSKGSLAIDATFRLLPVEDGDDAVTELLLRGVFGTEAARRLHPVIWARRTAELVGQRLTTTTTGIAATRHQRQAPAFHPPPPR
jgi:hypothetical protein